MVSDDATSTGAVVRKPPKKESAGSGLPPFSSEIRLVRGRHRGVLSRVKLSVLGTGNFRPLAQRPPIGYGRRPGRSEDACILDGEFELQPFTLVVGVASKASIGCREAEIRAD
jgi:hypothetical protein